MGGVILHLVHYSSVDEAQKAWDRRKERINYQNMYFVMNDRNQCSIEDMKRFDALPFEHKVIFTHLPQPKVKCSYYIKGMENEDYVRTMTAFENKLSLRRNIDQFDVIRWLNDERGKDIVFNKRET